MTHKKWVTTTISLFLVMLLILGSITFVVDPLYQYRYDENDNYYLNSKFSCAGLIKNYPYDSVMLGSSMTQNFDPDVFEKKMGLDLLKVNIGGMTVPETCFYLEYINRHSDCKKVFFSVDLQRFATPPDEAEFNIPQYLINGYEDDYRYLLGSEVYTRFLPVDLLIKGLEIANIEIPYSFEKATDIDELGSWYEDYSYGEDVVLNHLQTNGFGAYDIEAKGLGASVNENIDLLIETLSALDKDTEYILFFPPYSSLFWVYAKQNGIFEIFCDAKERIFELAQELENVTIFDFHNLELTADFENYRDISHYTKDINDYLVECFADGTGIVTVAEQLTTNKAEVSAKADLTYLKYKAHIDTYCKIE